MTQATPLPDTTPKPRHSRDEQIALVRAAFAGEKEPEPKRETGELEEMTTDG